MNYKGFFFDLDGVAYQGPYVIPTCRDFVNELVRRGIKVCFLTNNASRTPNTVANHLIELGYNIDEENIITSSQVTANYLKEQHGGKRVYMIGMNGLRKELQEIGMEIVDENADYVVTGLDLEINFTKLSRASQEISRGATFISTNSDIKLITANGVGPGNGAFTHLLEYVTGVKATYMGKPEPKMFEYGLKKIGLSKEEVVMVGDNYFTDIMGAINAGVDSIFVETGIMTKEEVLTFPTQPTYIVKDLSYFSLDD